MKDLKHIINKTLLNAITVLALFVISTSAVHAGFGISPSDISNKHLMPGDHMEMEIVLSRSDPIEDLDIVIEPALNEISSWFKFEPGMSFTFPKGQQRFPFKVIIDVPQDAPLNQFEGVIRIKASESGSDSGGVSIVKGARLDVELMTTDIAVTDLLVRSMNMKDVGQYSPLELIAKIENVGNTSSSPDEVKVTVMDLNQQPIKELVTTEIEEIEPYTTKEVSAYFDDHGLEIGEYFGVGQIIKDGSVLREERMVFRVTEGGESRVTLDGGDQGSDRFTKENILSGLALLGLLGALAYGFWRVLGKDKKYKKYEKIFNIVLAISLGFLVIGVMGIVLTNIPSADKPQTLETKEEIEATADPESSPNEDEDQAELTINEGTESAQVQGISTDNSENDNFNPLVVSNFEGEGYPIYQEPNYTSSIIQIANEGETFDVIDENSRWYQVVLSDGTSGWLPKSSIKSAN